MSSLGSVRDITANRGLLVGGYTLAEGNVQLITIDAAQAFWTPRAGTLHSFATSAAPRTLTITNAVTALPYDLKIGEGFHFWLQATGGQTITVAVGGTVVAGPGTFTTATGSCRHYLLTRTSQTAFQVDTFGTSVI